MPYCAEADLETLIPTARLAQFAEETGTVLTAGGQAIVAKVCVEESSKIDRYLAGADYVVPITDAPTLAILKPVAVTLVAHRFLGRRELSAGGDALSAEWERAMDWLEDVGKKKTALPPTAAKVSEVLPDPEDDYAGAGYGVAATSALSSSSSGSL